MHSEITNREIQIKDDLKFHRMIAFMMDLGEADRDELESMRNDLDAFVKKVDPEGMIISQRAIKSVKRCLRSAAKY